MRSLVPKVTVPAPDKVTIDAPEVVPEISNVPLAATLDEDAIAPEVLSAKVPKEIVVVPVYVLAPDNVSVPLPTLVIATFAVLPS